MKLSAIGSKNTYHKCLKELHHFGYIYYHSSVNKFYKSFVQIVKLDQPDSTAEKQQLDLFSDSKEELNVDNNSPVASPNSVQHEHFSSTDIDTAPVPYLTVASRKIDTVPVANVGLLIKHKQVNSKQEREENSLTQKIFFKNKKLQEGINAFSAAPKMIPLKPPPLSLPSAFGEGSGVRSSLPSPQGELSGVRPVRPHLSNVLTYFSQNNYPSIEAQKFFNHYQSNGWLVAGKTPMQNWQSSANKWMINTSNFQIAQKANDGNHEQRNIDTTPGKNYSQPL